MSQPPSSSKNGSHQKALPSHQRSRQSFAGTFERDHSETIAAMDSGGHDIPRQRPRTALSLGNVGVRRESIPVQIADPFGSGSVVQLSCAIDARVSLSGERRGIHVSRIGDLLARLSTKTFPTLADYARELFEGLLGAQEGESGSVTVEGILTYFERVRGVKEKGSLEHLTLGAELSGDRRRAISSSVIGFNHMTACPCVQETYRHSFVPGHNSLGKRNLQLITHTQRCQTRISLADLAQYPALGDLLGAIDAVVVRSQNTLPREFELLNVHRSHAEPQFLEDVLRDLLRAVYGVARPLSARGQIAISSVSLESIHDFDMHGEIAFTLKELDKAFRPRASTSSRNGNGSHDEANPPAGRSAMAIDERRRVKKTGSRKRARFVSR